MPYNILNYVNISDKTSTEVQNFFNNLFFRKGYCLEFLKTIGIEEADLDMTEDTVKKNRQIRANNKTMDMSSTYVITCLICFLRTQNIS